MTSPEARKIVSRRRIRVGREDNHSATERFATVREGLSIVHPVIVIPPKKPKR
jgi:hypothetical protein